MGRFIDMTIRAVNSSERAGASEGMPRRALWPKSCERLRDSLAANLLQEQDRWFLWLPVAVAVGIAAYFSLDQEPPRAPTAVLAAALSLSCWLVRRRPGLLVCGVLVLAVTIGFGAAQVRTALLEGPILQERTRPGLVTGRVVDVEPSGRRWRVILEDLNLQAVDEARTPARVRVVLQRDPAPPAPGATIRVKAVLMPLPKPAMPDAFDFARHAFFLGLGGVGYAISGVTLLEAPSGPTSISNAPSAVRRIVGARIATALDDGTEGGLIRKSLAEALLIGQRGAIPERITAAMRDSGLAHILAISGLHIGLVAGFVFFVVRAVLALVAPIALRWPVRKWAACVALMVALAYLLLSGATVPTQRAFLMLAIGLVAILVDRFQITMRPVAWAALAILLVMPETLVGASFQLSFAAVIGLVAAYEAVRARWRRIGMGAGASDPTRARVSVLGLYFLGVAFTSVVATMATGPFAVSNFNRLAVYGVAANLVAVPVTAFWIMPWGIVALALMPAGLETHALVPMAWGIDALTWVAEEVAGWPAAVWLVPAAPAHSVTLVALGGLWIAIWRRRWRLWGLPVMAVGLVTMALTDPPDVFVSGDGRLAAVNDGSGALRVSSLTREKFTRKVWMQRLGMAQASEWESPGAAVEDSLTCDSLGCIFRKGKSSIALPRDHRALLDDCAVSDAIVGVVPVRKSACLGPALILDRFDLWREGAHAVWIRKRGITHRSVRDAQGNRPWSHWPG